MMNGSEIALDDDTWRVLQQLAETDKPESLAKIARIEPQLFSQFLRECGEVTNDEALELLRAATAVFPRQAHPAADTVKTIAHRSGLSILQEEYIPSKSARYSVVPSTLDQRVRRLLEERFPHGLYSHQAEAIERALSGDDVCVATPTASGKSLVFMATTAHILLTQPRATVIALYPSKALIQDQLDKWKTLLNPLDVELGYVDGAVPTALRPDLFQKYRLLIMTPDVTHAWMMSHLADTSVHRFVSNLQLLILDETHVYDGVFGSNMAYFLRRLQAVAPVSRIISSTATVGAPGEFLDNLTGRRPIVFDRESDSSESPAKHVILAQPRGKRSFDACVDVVVSLAKSGVGRFLAFADSRKMVEQLVAATTRESNIESEDVAADEGDDYFGPLSESLADQVLPYRAGYEEEDRKGIQQALSCGTLAGVVSTSALELGLDIGEIDIVVLLGTPPTVKAFWQRLGRAGRKNPGVCLLVDDKGLIARAGALGLLDYMNKEPEKSWLYLDNRYLQYANALCAAVEASAIRTQAQPFESLPSQFRTFLNNELNPTEAIPDELYPLKQRAQGGPHLQFPLRSGVEMEFSVQYRGGPEQRRLGTLSYSQVLREAYPGAVYLYMARAYRVVQFNFNSGEIFVKRERRYSTRPLLQNKVFPKFQGGLLNYLYSSDSFVAESQLQVSERVMGFTEQRGRNKVVHEYGPLSYYSQRPINRFFETTGVCWAFSDPAIMNESVARAILEAFCSLCGIQARDVSVGIFHSNISPLSDKKCKGFSLYDSANGSLRLTQLLIERFPEVVALAFSLSRSSDKEDMQLIRGLKQLALSVELMERAASHPTSLPLEPVGDWVTVVAPGERAMCRLKSGAMETIQVKDFRYTPQGLMYQLAAPTKDVSWMVKASTVVPINGVTKLIQANLNTGETKALE